MWNEFDVAEIRKAIDDWPGSIGDSAWEDWSAELVRFSPQIVRQAIRTIRRTQEKNTRPSLSQLVTACERACGERHRERHGEACPWCEGRRLVKIHYWVLPWIELNVLEPPLPASMFRELDPSRVAVDPRVAEQLGARQEGRSIQCGRCHTSWRLPTVKRCIEVLGTFFRCDSASDAEVFDRCRQDQAPPPIQRWHSGGHGAVIEEVANEFGGIA